LGYDYDIEYKQGKENVPADALSRIPSKDQYAMTTSTISTSLIKEIRQSYANDSVIQHIIKDLQQSTASYPHYTWVNDHLNRKGNVVIGNNDELQIKLIDIWPAQDFYSHYQFHSHPLLTSVWTS
jgi:hypothetical protein